MSCSTDLLVDFQAPPPSFDQHHINAFITAVTQPGGPGEAAFNYLKTQANALPHGVVCFTVSCLPIFLGGEIKKLPGDAKT